MSEAIWTLNGTSLPSIGWSVKKVTRGAPWQDRAYLQCDLDFEGAFPVAFGSACSLALGGATLLQGKAKPLARGCMEADWWRGFEIAGAWSELEEVTYRQKFYAATWDEELEEETLTEYWRSIAIFMTDEDGDRIASDIQMENVVNFAHDKCNVDIAFGAGFDCFSPPPHEFEGTCAEAIMRLLRANPNIVPWMEYGGTPTLHCANTASLSTRNFPMAPTSAEPVVKGVPELVQRNDLAAAGVWITYERLRTFGPNMRTEILQESFPTSVSQFDPRVLNFTIQADPGQSNSTPPEQEVRTRPLPAEDASEHDKAQFLVEELPALKMAIEAGDIELSQVKVADYKLKVQTPNENYSTAGTEGPTTHRDWPTDPEKYPRQLVDGHVQSWMSGIRWAPILVEATLTLDSVIPSSESLKLVFGGGGTKKAPVSLAVKGTNATTRIYRGLSGGGETPAEWPPEGLAQAYYNQVSGTPWEGSLLLVGNALSDCPIVDMGTKLNVTNGAGEWSSMNAPVVGVEYSPDTRETLVRVGPLSTLSFQDFCERQRVMRNLNETSGSFERKTEADGRGGKSATNLGFQGPKTAGGFVGSGDDSHPWKVTPKKNDSGVVTGFYIQLGLVVVAGISLPPSIIASGISPLLMVPDTALNICPGGPHGSLLWKLTIDDTGLYAPDPDKCEVIFVVNPSPTVLGIDYIPENTETVRYFEFYRILNGVGTQLIAYSTAFDRYGAVKEVDNLRHMPIG